MEVSEIELPDARGDEKVSLSDYLNDEDTDAVVLLLQRDYYCTKCRRQTSAVAERYDDFVENGAEVVVVLPDDIQKARNWVESYDVPFPLLADPEKKFGEAFEQPVKFGIAGRLHDMIGRMPVATVFEVEDSVTLEYVYEGESYGDRPSVSELLAQAEEVAYS